MLSELIKFKAEDFMIVCKALRDSELAAMLKDGDEAPDKEICSRLLYRMAVALLLIVTTMLIPVSAKSVDFFFSDETLIAKMDVRGKVRNKAGKALAGATVRVKNQKRLVITDANGCFLLTGLDEKNVVCHYCRFISMYQIFGCKAKRSDYPRKVIRL